MKIKTGPTFLIGLILSAIGVIVFSELGMAGGVIVSSILLLYSLIGFAIYLMERKDG